MKGTFITSGMTFGQAIKPSLFGDTSSPTFSPTSGDRSIEDLESGGNYKAFNPNGGGEGAVGKHQFRWKPHKDTIRKFANNPNLTKEDYMNNPDLQDRFFNEYWKPKVLEPEARDLERKYKTGLPSYKLEKLVHIRGKQGAEEYLNGTASDKPESYNMSTSGYTGIKRQNLGLRKLRLGGPINPNKHTLKEDTRGTFKQYLDEATLPFRAYDKNVSKDIKNTVNWVNKKYPTPKDKLSALTAIGSFTKNPYISIPSAIINSGIDLYEGNVAEGVSDIPATLWKYGGGLKGKILSGVSSVVTSMDDILNKDVVKYGKPKEMNMGGVLSAYGTVMQPIAQAIQGDDPTNINRAVLAGAMQSGVIGAVTKGLQAHSALKAQNKQDRTSRFLNLPNSQASYQMLGNDVGYYAKGGLLKPEYEAEKGEIAIGNPQLEDGEEIAPGVHKVGGESHENGGTLGSGGEFMFSNDVMLDNNGMGILSYLGIKTEENISFSKAAELIGIEKNKFSFESHRYRESNTNKMMSLRFDAGLAQLAQLQEQIKQIV